MLTEVELMDWSHERMGYVLKIAVSSEVSGPHHLQCSSKGASKLALICDSVPQRLNCRGGRNAIVTGIFNACGRSRTKSSVKTSVKA